MDIKVDETSNLMAICGQNNVGKTNFLRALKLFFKPEEYEQDDIPKIKQATGGQSVYPKIVLRFFDDKTTSFYCITRDFKLYLTNKKGLSGYSYLLNNGREINKQNLSDLEIEAFLEKINFVYIDSVNVFLPSLIENLSDDMINIQYDKARFSESKKALKESYENYVDGLQNILNTFASDISSTFQHFQSDWNVKFFVPKNSNSFKDLISDDVTLTIDDNGSQTVEAKGAGLQRLTAILLYFEMIKRLKKRKSAILCIDEPDVFLHEGLQRKLKNFFDENSSEMQLFYTTHSKIFINPYNMKNVILFEANRYEQYSTRKGKNVSVTETYRVDLTNDEGYEKICLHLGIEKIRFEVLNKYNLLVEGTCDKKYLIELGRFFDLKIPNIETMNGADNALKYLDFYESYYKGLSVNKPLIKVVFDNDAKGREIYQRVAAKRYNNISVECVLLQNFDNTGNLSCFNNNTNNEMEDLVYPEIICYLINSILEKRNMNGINSKKICSSIKKNAFKAKGILELCEHEKNEMNPDNGADISFVSSSGSTNRIKESMANLFNLEANQKLLRLLSECIQKYPNVKNTIISLFTFSANDTR